MALTDREKAVVAEVKTGLEVIASWFTGSRAAAAARHADTLGKLLDGDSAQPADGPPGQQVEDTVHSEVATPSSP